MYTPHKILEARKSRPKAMALVERHVRDVLEDYGGMCSAATRSASSSLWRHYRREVRAEVRQRCLDTYEEEGVGFISISWILMILLGAVVQWWIKRRLDEKFPLKPEN